MVHKEVVKKLSRRGGTIAMLMRSLLYGVTAVDLPTMISVAGILAACAFVASYLPARRAASVHPMDALRAE